MRRARASRAVRSGPRRSMRRAAVRRERSVVMRRGSVASWYGVLTGWSATVLAGRLRTCILADMRISISDRALGTSARDRVYDALWEAIVSAELEPGRRLSENELGDLLGVSRTPVREALARLRDERLVAIVPQLGTFVTLISRQGVADAAFVREALECSAVRLATERATADDLAGLQANLAAQARARAAGDEAAFDRLDDALHRRICEISGHEIAWTLSRR